MCLMSSMVNVCLVFVIVCEGQKQVNFDYIGKLIMSNIFTSVVFYYTYFVDIPNVKNQILRI